MKKLLVNFLKKIFSPICLIISLYLLYYTYHQSEIYWNGIKSDYYLPYYIISTILIIFSILTFFLNQKIKEYLIILLISIIVGLYFFEGYFTFKEKNTRERLYEKETGKIVVKNNIIKSGKIDALLNEKYEFSLNIKTKISEPRATMN